MFTFGLVQASATIDASQNLNTVRSFTAQAKAHGCCALCFPEAFLTGYAPERAAELALTADADYIRQISDLAQREQIDILIGFMETWQNQFFLTHGILTADGNRQFYRKTHLGEREKTFFSSGTTLPVFSLSCGLSVGISLCVENHFPEIAQTLSLRGAQLIFAPHAVPRIAGDRLKIWSKYIPARSYDNRVYMACCNLWNDTRFGGGCLVTDPEGNVTASCLQDAPALLCFEVDPEKQTRFHSPDADLRHRYYPSKRQPDLYES